jgi:uncharacterized membrane protein
MSRIVIVILIYQHHHKPIDVKKSVCIGNNREFMAKKSKAQTERIISIKFFNYLILYAAMF